MLGRWEVTEQDSRPITDVRNQISSPLARRIAAVVRSLVRSGIEPDQITIDIDLRAVIVRAQEQIHLRAL